MVGADTIVEGLKRVPVAQWTERLPSKQRVVGSNPTWDASQSITLCTAYSLADPP